MNSRIVVRIEQARLRRCRLADSGLPGPCPCSADGCRKEAVILRQQAAGIVALDARAVVASLKVVR